MEIGGIRKLCEHLKIEVVKEEQITVNKLILLWFWGFQLQMCIFISTWFLDSNLSYLGQFYISLLAPKLETY